LLAVLLAAALIALPSVANADFFVLDNPGDPNFNQLSMTAGLSSVILVTARRLRRLCSGSEKSLLGGELFNKRFSRRPDAGHWHQQ
jgi:hypothetical protein